MAELHAKTTGHAVFRHLFVPVLIAGSVVSWLHHEAAGDHLRRAGWGVDFTTAGLLASVAIIWFAEQLYPSNPDWNYRIAANPVRGVGRLGRDLFYLTIGSLINGIIIGFLA